MLKIFLSVCLIGIVLSFTISKMQSAEIAQITHKPNSNNLQFDDNTGYYVTASQLNSFKKAINDAANLYGNDIQRNLNYIKTYMNTNEGNSSLNYFVFIQQYNYTLSKYVVYTLGGGSYASVRNANAKNPNWSYLMIKVFVSSTAPYFYINLASKGSGITTKFETFANQIIKTYEPDDICDCSGSASIQKNMGSFDLQNWNVVCDNQYDVNAYIYAVDQQWLYTKPQNCYYLLFVN